MMRAAGAPGPCCSLLIHSGADAEIKERRGVACKVWACKAFGQQTPKVSSLNPFLSAPPFRCYRCTFLQYFSSSSVFHTSFLPPFPLSFLCFYFGYCSQCPSSPTLSSLDPIFFLSSDLSCIALSLLCKHFCVCGRDKRKTAALSEDVPTAKALPRLSLWRRTRNIPENAKHSDEAF